MLVKVLLQVEVIVETGNDEWDDERDLERVLGDAVVSYYNKDYKLRLNPYNQMLDDYEIVDCYTNEPF